MEILDALTTAHNAKGEHHKFDSFICRADSVVDCELGKAITVFRATIAVQQEERTCTKGSIAEDIKERLEDRSGAHGYWSRESCITDRHLLVRALEAITPQPPAGTP